jgi:flagellar protein FlaG
MYVQAQNIPQVQAAATRASGPAPARHPSQPASAAASNSSAETASTVREAVAAINRAAKALNNSIQMSLDDRSERPVVRVVDSETGQLIRQIPTEEVLELRRALDRIAGLLINRTA